MGPPNVFFNFTKMFYLFSYFINTCFDFNDTLKILNDNNIKYTIETDELNLDTILI